MHIALRGLLVEVDDDDEEIVVESFCSGLLVASVVFVVAVGDKGQVLAFWSVFDSVVGSLTVTKIKKNTSRTSISGLILCVKEPKRETLKRTLI